MGITRIRRVKREIRVLGIASKPRGNLQTIVGVIYRGSLWLDGVLAINMRGDEASPTLRIAEMILESSHHPQIRVILLHRELLRGVRIDPYRLHLEVERPVIALSDDGGWPERREEAYSIGFKMEIGGERLKVLSIGLRSREAASILKVATREGEKLPEALRVAGLIASVLDQMT